MERSGSGQKVWNQHDTHPDFYERSGKERYRHVGFLEEKEIRKWLDMLLSI